jgi:hypothetical protein
MNFCSTPYFTEVIIKYDLPFGESENEKNQNGRNFIEIYGHHHLEF